MPLVLSLSMIFGVAWFGAWALDGRQAFLATQQQWSRAEREAVAELRKYLIQGDEPALSTFRDKLRVPQLYQRAREALMAEPPDRTRARSALIEAGARADDVGAMVWLAANLRTMSPVAEAMQAWTEGDRMLGELQGLAESARQLRAATPGSSPPIATLSRVDQISARLGQLEQEVTGRIGDAAHQVNHWLFGATSLMVAIMLVGGLVGIRVLTARQWAAESESIRVSRRLEFATQGSNEGIWDWHLESHQVYWTPRVRDMMGFESDEAFAQFRIRDHLHPDDQARAKAVLREHLSGFSERLELDVRLRCKSGDYRWFRFKAMSIRDEASAPVRLLGTIADIHVSVVAEQALHQAWQHSRLVSGELELALRGADVALWSFEPDTGRILSHRGWDSLLGRDTMPPTFSGWLELTHPDDRSVRTQLLNEHLNNATEYYESEFRMLHADGHYLWVRSRGRGIARDARGRAMQYAGAVMDISLQVEAREVQRRQQEFLREMIQWVDFGVVMSDLDKVVYANRAFVDLVGFEMSAELTGLPLATFFQSDAREQARRDRERAATGQLIPMRVVRLRGRGGRTNEVVMNLSCVDWNGSPHFIATVAPLARHEELGMLLRAASERFEEAMLQEQDRQQAQIARELHDSFGASLAGITLLLRSARNRNVDPQIDSLLLKCGAEVTQLAETSRRISRGIMPVPDYPGALADTLVGFASSLSTSGEVACAVEIGEGLVDMGSKAGNHLYRIVQEATTNAIKHGRAKTILITLAREHEQMSLRVLDDGNGGSDHRIDPAAKQGVGMKSMRARAQAIGGTLTVRHTQMGGREVVVSWPCGPASPVRAERAVGDAGTYVI